MKSIAASSILVCLVSLCGHSPMPAQRRAASAVPRIDVEHYRLEASLNPDAHEFKAAATITFRPLEETDIVVFEISENLSVQKVLDKGGIELEFGQDETGPGILSVRFGKRVAPGTATVIRVEYSGGFDRDRYSRIYSRDEASAYIGMDGSYLMYQSKWFPVSGYLVDRATASVEVTVPLGITVVGPGRQMPVTTRGVSETFTWNAEQPILPNSIVAGRYFLKTVASGGFTVDCFVREDRLESVQKYAEALTQILQHYEKAFGPSAAGRSFRLVEVDDRLATQPGTLGTIYLTHREISQASPGMRQLARKVAYQWWGETVGAQTTEDIWLVDGMSYFSAALFLEETGGPNALKDEISKLAVLGLKFESKGAVRTGLALGYRSDSYESVVAGKGAWVLLMLRQLVEPPKFRGVIQQYVRDFAGKGGTTQGLRKLAEGACGRELGWFFAQWLETTGVPNLQTDYMIYKTRDGFRVAGTIKQDRDLFRMPLEIEVRTKDVPRRMTFELNGKSTPFEIDTNSLPEQVVLDPDSKMLRDSRDLQISVQMSLGEDLRDKGQLVEAIRAYEAALKLSSRKSLAHFRLAEVFWDQFNLQASANSFRDALNGDKDPAWLEVWSYIYLGKIYDILNQRQRAMAEYNKAINTKDDTNGAQAEAKKWLAAPFTRERTTMEKETRQPDLK